MSTYLLVHGAMHGGWCWRDVIPLLDAAGHESIAVTLTGQGDRADELTPDTGVRDHIADIVEAAGDQRDLIVVAHSYSGVLLGPVVERLGDRVTGVVAAGAFLVEPGQSLLDVEPEDTARRYREVAADAGDGWRIPASPAFLDQWAVTDPDLRAFIGARLTDFPLRCATDPVDYDPAPLQALPKTYIEHTDPPLLSLNLSIERARADGWQMRAIPTGHDLMLTAPRATAEALLDAGA